MKDLLESYPEQNEKLLLLRHCFKRMITKISLLKEYGNSREYHLLVKKTAYFSKTCKRANKEFFLNDSRFTCSLFY
jgi:hypothetical protein